MSEPMPLAGSESPRLAELRASIDELDERLLALLCQRLDVVREIGRLKASHGDGLALRPSREAVILRRLVARAAGQLPAVTVVRIWRELLAAATRSQTPMSVAVAVEEGGPAIWDLARDHFGATTPCHRVERAAQALRNLLDGSVQLAVLPPPGDEAEWWRGLLAQDTRMQVVAKLPFLLPETAGPEQATAFVVAAIETEPSGDDASLIAIETPSDVSRGHLRELLTGAGLEPSWLAATRVAGSDHAQHLVEVAGFVANDDKRLADLAAARRGEIDRIVSVGAFARPLRLPAGG